MGAALRVVGGLLGVPFCLAIFRARGARWPLDAVTLALLGWNHTAAGTLLTHWAPDDDERLRTWRRAYSAALSVALAWLLTALPWLTAVMALLLLGVLDLVLVALPGAPVQKLDRLATRRRAAGERQPPGLTLRAEGLELGLGDFVIYGAVAAYSVALGSGALAAGLVGVLGLALTMARLALARRARSRPRSPPPSSSPLPSPRRCSPGGRRRRARRHGVVIAGRRPDRVCREYWDHVMAWTDGTRPGARSP